MNKKGQPESLQEAAQQLLLGLLIGAVTVFIMIAGAVMFFTNPFGLIKLVVAAVVLGFVALVVIAFWPQG